MKLTNQVSGSLEFAGGCPDLAGAVFADFARRSFVICPVICPDHASADYLWINNLESYILIKTDLMIRNRAVISALQQNTASGVDQEVNKTMF